ncbi:MAG: hypothetical protein MJE77_19055 [Proteobacteria bacterium]|nr:hypothetical protein [Pseudomonadota bacterium]
MSSQHSSGPTLPTATVARSGTHGRPYKRRFRNYLLNKSLQLRYIGVVTVISAVLLGTLGTMIWQQKNLASSQILASMDKLELGEVRAQIDDDLTRRDTNWILRLVGVAVGLVFVLFFWLLVMTHKVAGPLHKVSRYFDRMAQGRLGETYPLRRGDMLRDFYAKFKAMHDAVRIRHQEENQVIARFLTACEAAGVKRQGELGARLDELEKHCEERKQALS